MLGVSMSIQASILRGQWRTAGVSRLVAYTSRLTPGRSPILGDAGVDDFGLLGDTVPAESGIDSRSTVATHPATAAVVGQQRTQSPGDRVRCVVHLQAVDAVADELGRSTALGTDDRFVGRPAFEDDDTEWLIAAGHRHDIARLEEIVQFAAAPIAQHAQRVRHAHLMGDGADIIAHVAIADEDEFGVGIITKNRRHGADENVRPFLHHHAADEQNGRIERPNGVATFDLAGIDRVIEGAGVDAVVDDFGFVVGALVEPADLALELIGYGDDAIGAVGAVALVFLNAVRLPSEELVAVATVFGRVHGQDALAPASFLDPHERVGGQPIVSMHDVKGADVIFHGEELVDEGPAHIVDFIDEIGMQREVAAVIVNAVETVVVRLLMAATGKHMNFMLAAIESGREFRDVDADAAHGDTV